jgi:hypothetical protein
MFNDYHTDMRVGRQVKNINKFKNYLTAAVTVGWRLAPPRKKGN